ncbi:hypothetical protein A4A49_22931 [Nicotiana attenuata]|uniref:Ubiquitin-like domain-containing protein n=1 Tax=Nicotiana attenuata TaxID=49451 RepID=A0A314LGC7_NICAT|nr:hypothetical protein A4A49_22931 [Nicotiana attenuata]
MNLSLYIMWKHNSYEQLIMQFSIATQLVCHVAMAEPQKLKIKVESETSEFNVKIKETDKVGDLLEIIKVNWGDDCSYKLEHYSIEMKTDQPLSAYNLRDGSVVKVTCFADSP